MREMTYNLNLSNENNSRRYFTYEILNNRLERVDWVI